MLDLFGTNLYHGNICKKNMLVLMSLELSGLHLLSY